jgi:fructokinase
MISPPSVLCFGEVLWDSTPKGIFLGGAPVNVAYHLHELGLRSVPVSAVGNDYLGEEILRRIASWGVPTEYIAKIPTVRTGVVQVDLTHPDNPTYDIIDNVAWDLIPATASLASEFAAASAVVFGSLSLRHESNQRLLKELMPGASGVKVFDVNLRQPYFNAASVLALAKSADLVKVNIDELELLHPFAVGSIEVMAATFSDLIGGKKLCVTAGKQGAGLWDGSKWHWEDARATAVKGDAVGAGDAFLAALISELVAGRPIASALSKACRLAEFVASSDGAQPIYDASSFAFA